MRTLSISGMKNAAPTTATSYFCVGLGDNSSGTATNESVTQHKVYVDGTFSYLIVSVTGNTRTGASTINFRKNGANGNITISVPATTTGFFSDASNTDSIASGDNVGYRVVPGGAGTSIIVKQFNICFTPLSGKPYVFLTSSDGGTVSTASTTYYLIPGGTMNTMDTTESANQMIVNGPGVLSNLEVVVRTNTRTTTTTARSRINSSNGNIVISITAATTGHFYDTTNSDTVVVGDEYTIGTTLGTGTGNFRYYLCSIHFKVDGVVFPIPSGKASGQAFSPATTYYPGVGVLTNETTASNSYMTFHRNVTLNNLRVYVSANSLSNTSTAASYVNGATGNQSVSIPSASTGLFLDYSNFDTLMPGDTFNYYLATGAGGTSLTINRMLVSSHLRRVISS